MQQLGEEQKKALSSYLFSHTTTSRLIVSARGKLEAQLPPLEGQAQHEEYMHFLCEHWKPTNPAIQTKNNLLENTFNAEIHMVGWKEWWFQNQQNINREKKNNQISEGALDAGMAWKRYKKDTGFLLLQRC